MPRVHLNQTNFTAGELSRDMLGRTDIDRYPNAAKVFRNVFAKIQGGAKGREGTRFVVPAKFSNKDARILPFVFDRKSAYILEFGDFYMRVYRNRARIETSPGVAYEIATPYSAADVLELDYAQRSDTMFIFHPYIPTQRLRRFGDATWDIAPAPWVYEPMAELGFKPAATLTLSSAAVGPGVTATASAPVFLASDVGRDITSSSGLATITGFTSTTVVTVQIIVAFQSTAIPSGTWLLEGSPQTICTPSAVGPVGAIITLTLSAPGWRASDVGKIVSINGGQVEITVFTSATVVSGRVITVLTSLTGSEALAWELRSSMWGGEYGYPSTGTFYEQRLIMGGSPGFPRHVFGSAVGLPLDFQVGIEDDEGFATPIADSDEIRYLASVRALTAMSYNGEFILEGGVEKPIAPTNIQITNTSNYGIDAVRPVRIGNELYFVQRAGKKLRVFTYRFTEDSFDAPDMTKLANHIAGPGIIEMSYQQEPYSRLLCVRSDGVIAQVTIDRTESVVAWAPWTTDGGYISVATIPAGDRDETWALVVRNVNGSQQVYVEFFDPDTHTDSCVVQESGVPTAVWTGYDHLNGKTVQIVADGVVMPPMLVTGGTFTLPREAVKVEAGLGYEPYIELLPVEFPTGSGTAQGAQGRVGEIIVRLHETIGCTIVDPDEDGFEEVLPFRRFGVGILDAPVAPFSGDLNSNKLGWKKSAGNLVIKQSQPLPFEVLSVVRRVTVND